MVYLHSVGRLPWCSGRVAGRDTSGATIPAARQMIVLGLGVEMSFSRRLYGMMITSSRCIGSRV